MNERQELQVREKKELAPNAETTHEGVQFTPEVDIYELDSALVVVADVPGTGPDGIGLDLQDNTLALTASVRPVEPRWKPVYTEYEVGGFARQFRIGQIVDRDKISAQVKDGVLVVTMPKIEKAQPRKIVVRTDD